MFSKSKSWMSGGVWKPKNPHSLDHLKYLYGILCKNATVTEQNLGLLVETLRSTSEILIWGDQNDSSVFDFFLEKNMLVFFLRFMRQKSGQHICVQLLQTLNILFENISNETSIYYLLSNNHINSIIVHKFDFCDEEVMAYYISFLKTLSFKLNKHTIHFFYNEHTNDFALYTEAIKFFNHTESMVRIAVRTITLNVYRVDDKSMLCYIRDRTAAPYFSNLVWFIGSHVLELDACVLQDIDHSSRGRLADLVAEHLDHLHYLNDILCLDISALNDVLCEHLLNYLFIPLYVHSLIPAAGTEAIATSKSAIAVGPRIASIVSLFLLSQVFLIIHYAPLVNQLMSFIFGSNMEEFNVQENCTLMHGFVKPLKPLADSLVMYQNKSAYEDMTEEVAAIAATSPTIPTIRTVETTSTDSNTIDIAQLIGERIEEKHTSENAEPVEIDKCRLKALVLNTNSTDEEKLYQSSAVVTYNLSTDFDLSSKPLVNAIFNSLDCVTDDYQALFALCLLYAVSLNRGINKELLNSFTVTKELSTTKHHYNMALVDRLIHIMSLACQSGSKIRLVTLELAILLLKSLVCNTVDGHSFLHDDDLAAIEGVREEATLLMRTFYKVWEKSEEIFLDMFEDEYRELTSHPLNVEHLTMDACVMLPPTSTPLTGIDFNRRLPCGEVERAKRAIRVFFLIRNLSFLLRQEAELQLPLTREDECVKVDDVLDLNNSDLIACTVIAKDSNKKDRRFLVIDVIQLILVEPDSKRLGWGVVRFVGFLQDVEVTGDKDDSRCLHVTVLRPTTISGGPAASCRPPPRPLLAAKFIFDDHIRCMAARQRLVKGRLRARQRKMQMIARLLDMQVAGSDSIVNRHNSLQRATTSSAQAVIPGRSHVVLRQQQHMTAADIQQSVFASVEQVATFNIAAEHENEQQLSKRRIPRLPQPHPEISSTVSANKKKLLSMAFQAQKQRREAAAAATVTSVKTAAATVRSLVDTVSSSDTDGTSSPTSKHSVYYCSKSTDEQISYQTDCGLADYVGDPVQSVCSDSSLYKFPVSSVSCTAYCTASLQPLGTAPKTLMPAASLPASLVLDDCPAVSSDTDKCHSAGVLDSPVKLMPPADPKCIQCLPTVSMDKPDVPLLSDDELINDPGTKFGKNNSS